jgi:hypothetical protein
MTDLTALQQMVDQARVYAHQARHYAREARLRAAHMTQIAQHASLRGRIAYLRLSMPEANRLTQAITATLLARRGLLDEKPTLRPPRPATGGRR